MPGVSDSGRLAESRWLLDCCNQLPLVGGLPIEYRGESANLKGWKVKFLWTGVDSPAFFLNAVQLALFVAVVGTFFIVEFVTTGDALGVVLNIGTEFTRVHLPQNFGDIAG